MTEQSPELAAQIEALDRSLEAVHETLRKEGKKRDKRIRTNRILTWLAVGVAVVGITVGFQGRNALNSANSQRDAARIASCQQYNVQQRQGIKSDIEQSHDLVDALAKGQRDAKSPTVDAAVIAYNKKHDAIIRHGHPLRDCSPAGIDKYLNTQK